MSAAFCTECGGGLDPGARFCASCGSTVIAVASPQAAASPPSPEVPGSQSPAARRGRRRWPIVLAAFSLVAAAAAGAWLVTRDDGGDSPSAAAGTTALPSTAPDGTTGPDGTGDSPPDTLGVVIDLGGAEGTVPDQSAVMATTTWGLVPTDRFYVVGGDSSTRADFEGLAASLSGSVTGEIPYIGLFEISIPPAGEQGLAAGLAAAEAMAEVDLAFPDQVMAISEEIRGVRTSPLSDPVYSGDRGRGYQAIGVERAWNYIRGSGLPINGVSVGIADTGLWRGGGEFDDAKITFPDPDAGEIADPQTWSFNGQTDSDGFFWSSETFIQPDGSHGTAVATVMGADGDDGGAAGVASILGDKLGMAHIDIFGPKYGGYVQVPPDPNDPTQYADGSGGAWSVGALRALVKLVESPAKPKIINMSWNCAPPPPALPGECGEDVAAAYARFFKKMADDHPDVLFVASAGNHGRPLNGKKAFPAGLSLPNMITVGNITNDAETIQSSSRANTTAGEEYEVTVAAPGHQAVRGVRYDGAVVDHETVIGTATRNSDGAEWNRTSGGGTSMAAPQVAATAALMKSLDPSLTAGDIKRIIAESARTSVEGSFNLVSPQMGAGALATDAAVLAVIKRVREKNGMPKLSDEDLAAELESRGVIDAVAITGEPGEYTVRGIVPGCGDGCTAVSIRVSGEHALSGDTTQTLSAPGEVSWAVTLEKLPATIFVQRRDNGAGSLITIEQVEVAGVWTGTLTMTKIVFTEEQTLPDGTAIEPGEYEGEALELCADEWEDAIGDAIKQALDELRNGIPLTLEFTGTLEQPGTVLPSSESSADPEVEGGIPWRAEGTSIVWEWAGEDGYGAFSGTVSGTTMTGSWGIISPDATAELRGVFIVTKVG